MVKSILTNIIIPIIAIGGVGMAIYTSMIEDPRIAENMRVADSLRAEVNKYHQQYDSLLIVAGNLNKKMEDQQRKIDSLKTHPPKPPKPKPPVTEVQDAIDVLMNLQESNMKWTLPILFLLAITTSNGQSKDSTVSLPKNEVIRIANRVREMRDTINWLYETIDWQKNIITEQDTLISQQKQRFVIYDQQLDNRQNAINTLEKENEVLRNTITIMMPKWYDNKWLWFGSGATVATIILGVIL